jgi:hypothetical protein
MRMSRLIPMLPVRSMPASVEYHRRVFSVRFYGLTEFRLEDPDGNRLWIGQRTTPQ